MLQKIACKVLLQNKATRLTPPLPPAPPPPVFVKVVEIIQKNHIFQCFAHDFLQGLDMTIAVKCRPIPA